MSIACKVNSSRVQVKVEFSIRLEVIDGSLIIVVATPINHSFSMAIQRSKFNWLVICFRGEPICLKGFIANF